MRQQSKRRFTVLQPHDSIRVYVVNLRSPLNIKTLTARKSRSDLQFALNRGINKTHKMISKICIVLLMQLAGVAFAAGKDCSNETCPSIPKHYEELECEGVKVEGECCASR